MDILSKISYIVVMSLVGCLFIYSNGNGNLVTSIAVASPSRCMATALHHFFPHAVIRIYWPTHQASNECIKPNGSVTRNPRVSQHPTGACCRGPITNHGNPWGAIANTMSYLTQSLVPSY